MKINFIIILFTFLKYNVGGSGHYGRIRDAYFSL
jgi:hypothetical protein